MNNALAPLSDYPQFIIYSAVSSTDRPGKTDKLPINHISGQKCNAQDPANWTDEATASKAADKFGKGYGVGFVLTENDPYFCLDIDCCLMPDGKNWSPLALSLTERLTGAAVEVSLSGTGLHIWGQCKDAIPAHRCRNGVHSVEQYTEARFIALGHPNAVGDASTDCTETLTSVIADYFPASSGSSMEPAEWTDGGTNPADDDALIDRMLASKSATSAFGSGVSFAQLWKADESEIGRAYPDIGERKYDASRADAALAQHLAFWTGNDCERIKRLMLRSALMRDKWKRNDYLRRTILGVCAKQVTVIQSRDTSSFDGVSGGDEGWSEPQAIPCSLLPVEPFNDNLLPKALRVWVADIAERMQCPPDFPAVGAMVA